MTYELTQRSGPEPEPAERRREEARARPTEPSPATPLLAIVGSPNVGKSVLFNNLTGRYVVVSNYPGTTVEVSRGQADIGGRRWEVIDTPGMYSVVPISGEERVAREVLLERRPEAVLHVVDAKNLGRMLPLTFQLMELGLPVILVLNMLDEARRVGLEVDLQGLSRDLGIPVVGAIAPEKVGMEEILRQVGACAARAATAGTPVRYAEPVERAAGALAAELPESFRAIRRGASLLFLQADADLERRLEEQAPGAARRVRETAAAARDQLPEGAAFSLALSRHEKGQELIARHVRETRGAGRGFAERLSDLTVNPWTGVPILLAVLYLGLYQFVGVFGAGTVVDFLENALFGTYVTAPFNALMQGWLPQNDGWQYWLRELFAGEYGLVTLGASYAVAIVLPIVFLFFLFFSLLEDSGYFPRLAMLVDRVFKRFGLNGRAVIPIVLGFGCVTMATMVTRIQETRRERFITTLLLALAIPCSAQYGVITGLLASQPAGALGIPWAFLAWGLVMLAIFTVTGMAASRLVKGQPASFYMELPPLRLPRLGNVVLKTLARMKWYFLEVFPLFLLASALIWAGRLTGLFDLLVRGLEPVVRLIGLPDSAASVFLYGFFRRDFGAAGLYDLAGTGGLSTAQLLVACVTLTLFLPCVAQLLIMKKERGLKAAAAMSVGIVAFAFLAGGALNLALGALGVSR